MEDKECSDEEFFYDCCEDTVSEQISHAVNNASNLETITQTKIATSKQQLQHGQEEVITPYSAAVETDLCPDTGSQMKGKDSIDIPRNLTLTGHTETTISDCITQNSRHGGAMPSSTTLDPKQIPVLDRSLETESYFKESEGVVQTGTAETNGSNLYNASNIENSEDSLCSGGSFGSEPMAGHEKSPTLVSGQAGSALHSAGEPTEEWRDATLKGTPSNLTELEVIAGDVNTVTRVEDCAPNPGLSESSAAAETMNHHAKVVGVSQGHDNDKDQTDGPHSQGQAQYGDQTFVEKSNAIEESLCGAGGQQPKVIEEDQAIEDQTQFEQPKDMEEAQGHDQACEEENDESSDDESTLTEIEIDERRIEAKQLKDEGNVAYKNGDFVEAERLYTEALKICPKSFKKDRAVMYSNRSACLVKMDKTEPAIEDCTKAVELHPTYVKAFLRRAQLYENLEKYEEAMDDCNKVLELDPGVHTARATLLRLPEEIEKRNEKLKAKMMSSLKDIGNLFLRPFGLSTENFQMQQDPNSGSYNIQFNNGQSGQTNGPGNGI